MLLFFFPSEILSIFCVNSPKGGDWALSLPLRFNTMRRRAEVVGQTTSPLRVDVYNSREMLLFGKGKKKRKRLLPWLSNAPEAMKSRQLYRHCQKNTSNRIIAFPLSCVLLEEHVNSTTTSLLGFPKNTAPASKKSTNPTKYSLKIGLLLFSRACT